MAGIVTRANQRLLTDDKKWAAAARLLRSVNAMKKAIATYGTFSPEVGAAIKEAQLAEREYRKLME